MATKTWGLLCPEDQGLLIERPEWSARGVAWCPNEDAHGGNGRTWRLQEVKEGWYDPTRTAEPTPEYLERQAKAAARAEEITKVREERERKNRSRSVATEKTKAPKAAAEPKSCMCGCGGMTKGGRFIPGHDARFHSRVRALEAQGVSHDEAAKIASKGPLTGKYATAAAAANKAKATPAPKPATAAKTRRPKPVDLTAKASDEPAAATDGQTAEPDIEV